MVGGQQGTQRAARRREHPYGWQTFSWIGAAAPIGIPLEFHWNSGIPGIPCQSVCSEGAAKEPEKSTNSHGTELGRGFGSLLRHAACRAPSEVLVS